MGNRWNQVIKKATGAEPARGEVEMFIDGPEYFKRLAQDLRSVSAGNEDKQDYFIYILGWMMHVDLPLNGNDTILSLLQAATGVEVKVLLWESPIPDYYLANKDSIKKLSKLPNAVACTDPFTYSTPQSKKTIRQFKKRVIGMMRYVDLTNLVILKGMVLKGLLKLNSAGSHHEKNIIIRGPNGLVAYCGGIDLNKNRIPSNKQHDTQCRVEGKAAYDLLDGFLLRWKVFATLTNKIEFSELTLRGTIEARQAPPVPNKNAPFVRAVGTYNTPVTNNTSLKKVRDRSAKQVILAAIANAKEYVYIEDQYMTSLSVAKALHDALKGSLKRVIILTQTSVHSKPDIQLPNRKRAEFVDTLLYGRLRNGLGPEELALAKAQIPIAARYDKVEIYQVTDSPNDAWHEIVHSKLYLIDDEVMIVGSMNCNERCLTHDSESGVIVVDEVSNKTSSLVAAFRHRLWAHHLSMQGLYWAKLKKHLKKLPDPIVSSKNWELVTPAIERYLPKGDDLDVDLQKRIQSVAKGIAPKSFGSASNRKEKALWVLEQISVEIRNSTKITSDILKRVDVETKSFRDPVWELVDPNAP